jgi:hypothetical protein
MTRVNHDLVRTCLKELSNKELQERLWSATGEEVSSFEEAVCQLFDDSGLGDSLAKGETVFSPELDALLLDLREHIRKVDPQESPMSIIESPTAVVIRALTYKILSQMIDQW